jgi:hypothetical protein
MRNQLRMTWRVGVAMIGLGATALVVGTPSALAQGPYTTEIHGAPPGGAIEMPGGGAYQVGGDDGPGFNEVIVDDGGRGHMTSGGSAPPPLGPACTVEIVGHGGGRDVAHNADPGCGVTEAHGPIGISGGMTIYP